MAPKDWYKEALCLLSEYEQEREREGKLDDKIEVDYPAPAPKKLNRLHRVVVILGHCTALLADVLVNRKLDAKQRAEQLATITPIVRGALAAAQRMVRELYTDLTVARDYLDFLFRGKPFENALAAVIHFAILVLNEADRIGAVGVDVLEEEIPNYLRWVPRDLRDLKVGVRHEVANLASKRATRNRKPPPGDRPRDEQTFKVAEGEAPAGASPPIQLLGRDKKPNARIDGEEDTVTPRQYDAAELLLQNPRGFTVAELRAGAKKQPKKYRGVLEALRALKKQKLWAPWVLSPDGSRGKRWRFHAQAVATPRTPRTPRISPQLPASEEATMGFKSERE